MVRPRGAVVPDGGERPSILGRRSGRVKLVPLSGAWDRAGTLLPGDRDAGRSAFMSSAGIVRISGVGWMAVAVKTLVHSVDRFSRLGMVSQLRADHRIDLLDEDEASAAEVVVSLAHRFGDEEVSDLHRFRRPEARVVLVSSVVDEATVVRAAEAGVCGVLRRGEASIERVVGLIRVVAAGGGEVPSDLAASLLGHLGRLQREVLAPRGRTFFGLNDRERSVLSLLADGEDTAGIARTLAYSERTVKGIVHDIRSRLQLRNRSHVVAYAIREGLI